MFYIPNIIILINRMWLTLLRNIFFCRYTGRVHITLWCIYGFNYSRKGNFVDKKKSEYINIIIHTFCLCDIISVKCSTSYIFIDFKTFIKIKYRNTRELFQPHIFNRYRRFYFFSSFYNQLSVKFATVNIKVYILSFFWIFTLLTCSTL